MSSHQQTLSLRRYIFIFFTTSKIFFEEKLFYSTVDFLTFRQLEHAVCEYHHHTSNSLGTQFFPVYYNVSVNTFQMVQCITFPSTFFSEGEIPFSRSSSTQKHAKYARHFFRSMYTYPDVSTT